MARLFVTCLRIKLKPDNIPFLWNVAAHHDSRPRTAPVDTSS